MKSFQFSIITGNIYVPPTPGAVESDYQKEKWIFSQNVVIATTSRRSSDVPVITRAHDTAQWRNFTSYPAGRSRWQPRLSAIRLRSEHLRRRRLTSHCNWLVGLKRTQIKTAELRTLRCTFFFHLQQAAWSHSTKLAEDERTKRHITAYTQQQAAEHTNCAVKGLFSERNAKARKNIVDDFICTVCGCRWTHCWYKQRFRS